MYCDNRTTPARMILAVILGVGLTAGCQGSVREKDADQDAGDADAPDGTEMDNVAEDGWDADADPDVDLDVDVEIPPHCGNGIVDEGEDCDPVVSEPRSCTTTCGSAGMQECTSWCAWGACVPPGEECNGLDDDCDGEADNGFECSVGDSEVCFPYCGSEAVRTCREDCTWGPCEAPGVVCNAFIVPHMEDPWPGSITIVASTPIQKADVYFIIDATGTMTQEIDNLKGTFRSVIAPGIMDEIPDVWFGVMQFQDCPGMGCGASAIQNLQNLTGNLDDVESAFDAIADPCGGWEPYTQALYVAATGDGAPWSLPARTCTDATAMTGYPCFRDDALPILVQVGDEEFSQGESYCEPSVTVSGAVDAINDIHGKYVGIDSGDAQVDMAAVADGTGSVDVGGNPLVFEVPADGAGLAGHIVDAAVHLAQQASLRVSARVRDDAADDFDATVFVERVEANTVDRVEDPDNPGVFCTTGLAASDADGDGFVDTFTSVTPGTSVCFDVVPAMNETRPSTGEPQTFKAWVEVLADGVSVLDTEEFEFIVP